MKKTITITMILAAGSVLYGLTLVYGGEAKSADRATDGLFMPVDKSWDDAPFVDQKVDPLWVALGYRGNNNPGQQKTDANGKPVEESNVSAASADSQTLAERVRAVQSDRVRWLLGVPVVAGVLVVVAALAMLLFRKRGHRADFARGLMVAQITPARVVLEHRDAPIHVTKNEPTPVRRAA